MKKLLGSVLAITLLANVGTAGATEILKNLKVNGSMDFQANSAKNVCDFANYQNDRIGNAVTRVLVDMNWDLLDDIHSVVTLRKNDRAWGSDAASGQAASGSQALQGGAGSGLLDQTYLQQAYVKVDKFIGNFDAQIGRQYYGEPGDLIIYYGPKNSYGLYVTALDALRLDWANDMLGVTGLVAKSGRTKTIAQQADVETDIRGLNVVVKQELPAKLSAYAYNVETHRTLTDGAITIYAPNDHLWVYGLKAKMEAQGASLTGQFAGNFGENRTTTAERLYRGWAFLLDANYKADVANVGTFTPWLNFGFGTGDQGTGYKNHGFTAIASGYTPGIINGRFNGSGATQLTTANGNTVDTVGLNNRVVYGLGLKATPASAEKLVMGLGFWDYRVQTPTQGNNAAHNAAGDIISRHIGYEYGLTADWKHSENVSYGIALAQFRPGGIIKNDNTKKILATVGQGAVNSVTTAYADLTLKF